MKRKNTKVIGRAQTIRPSNSTYRLSKNSDRFRLWSEGELSEVIRS